MIAITCISNCQSNTEAGENTAKDRNYSIGYSEYTNDEYSYSEEDSYQSKGGGNSDDPTQTPSKQRRIIKTGQLRMQVENVEENTETVKTLVEQYNGYISSQNLTNTSYEIQHNFIIRVPFDQFEPLMDALAAEAIYVKQRSVNAQDVTEEFVDIETRLKTKKAVRDRYVEILRTKAKTVEEILKAEEAIRVVQEEIEAREGRLNYLKDQTALSTINLNVYQRVEYQPEPSTYRKSFFDRMLTSLQNGWELVQTLFLGLISIWPLLIILAILVWQRKRIFRRRRRNVD